MLRCAIRGAHGLDALYRKAELALLAPSSSQYFVYLPLSIQRSQARSKYIHVCSDAPSVAHMACTRYTERPIYAAGFLLFAVLCLSGTFDTTLPAPCSQLSALSSQLSALSSQLSALSSQLSALSSQLSPLSSGLSALGSQLPA